MSMCHFLAQYSPICSEHFFWYKQLLSSSYWSFSLSKIFKKSFSKARVMRMHHCWAQNGPFAPYKCFKKIIYVNFFYLLAPFVMRMHLFWAQNSPFAQMIIFFKKPVNKPCSFHSSLSTCQKSKLDIHLLMIYWQLKNTEIPLAKNIFGCNLRARFFPSMQFSQNVNEPKEIPFCSNFRQN